MAARILLVDDEADAQELFRQHFRREIRKGVYTFEFALSGESALEILTANDASDFSLVVSDINMPGMSGTELLAEVRDTRPDLPVMMITAYGDASTEAQVRNLGAERFLTKPVDFGQVRQAFSDVAGHEP